MHFGTVQKKDCLFTFYIKASHLTTRWMWWLWKYITHIWARGSACWMAPGAKLWTYHRVLTGAILSVSCSHPVIERDTDRNVHSYQIVTLAHGLPTGLAEPFRTALQPVALPTQPFFLPSLLSPSQGTHLPCHPNSPDLLQLFPLQMFPSINILHI